MDLLAWLVVLVAFAMSAVALAIAVAGARARARDLARPVPSAGTPSLSATVRDHGIGIAGLEAAFAGLEDRTEALEGAWRHAIAHVGLVRFDAFDDVGGMQSFALALLDPSADGVVISSLHGRGVNRVYVKPIIAGRCDAPLADEEVGALRDAGLEVAASG